VLKKHNAMGEVKGGKRRRRKVSRRTDLKATGAERYGMIGISVASGRGGKRTRGARAEL
jgi:hypothetical protein